MYYSRHMSGFFISFERFMKKQASNPLHAVGRRKKAVARVWLKKGKGVITVNGRTSEEFFNTDSTRDAIFKPLQVTGMEKMFDVQVNVNGGGQHGQSDAVKLGIARALLEVDEKLRPELRKHGFLTVDARVKERKKPGQKGARAKFQFVKR